MAWQQYTIFIKVFLATSLEFISLILVGSPVSTPEMGSGSAEIISGFSTSDLIKSIVRPGQAALRKTQEIPRRVPPPQGLPAVAAAVSALPVTSASADSKPSA